MYPGCLVRETKNVKVHLAEPVVASGIKHHLQNQVVTSLCTGLVRHCVLKVQGGAEMQWY